MSHIRHTHTKRSSRINKFGADITVEYSHGCLCTYGPACNTAAGGVHAIRQIARPDDLLAHLLVDEVAKSMGLPISDPEDLDEGKRDRL